MSNQKQRSATERLSDTEQALQAVFQTLDNMGRDLMLCKDAIKLLGNKLDAVVKAANLSDDTISALMVQNNVDELKGKVDALIAQGILEATTTVDAQSFLVIREIDDAGKVVNPRLQFTMGALDPAISEKLIGGQPGQTIEVKEGALKVEILEVYGIKTAQPAPAAEAAPAEATAPESAPAAEAPAAPAPTEAVSQ